MFTTWLRCHSVSATAGETDQAVEPAFATALPRQTHNMEYTNERWYDQAPELPPD
jgi:hypothetical protein